MSTYDPTSIIYPSGNFSLDGLISEIKNEISTSLTFNQNNGVATTSSASLVSLLSSSVAVEIDEVCLFLSLISVSAGTTADKILTVHKIDGVDQNNYGAFYEPSGATTGDHSTITSVSRLQDKATGTYTFDLQWRNDTAARAIYSLWQRLFVFKWKRRT